MLAVVGVQRAVDIRVDGIAQARVIGVVIRVEGAELAVASAHLDLALPLGGRIALLGARRRWVDSAPRGLVVVSGDWNSVPPDETRVSAEGADARSADRAGERCERMFENTAEVFYASRRSGDVAQPH